jgi:hypothetical protein
MKQSQRPESEPILESLKGLSPEQKKWMLSAMLALAKSGVKLDKPNTTQGNNGPKQFETTIEHGGLTFVVSGNYDFTIEEAAQEIMRVTGDSVAWAKQDKTQPIQVRMPLRIPRPQ